MDIYQNPLYVSRVGGHGDNQFIDDYGRQDTFNKNVSKSSTKDPEVLNRLLDNVHRRRQSANHFYPEARRPFWTPYRG